MSAPEPLPEPKPQTHLKAKGADFPWACKGQHRLLKYTCPEGSEFDVGTVWVSVIVKMLLSSPLHRGLAA